MRVRRGAVEVLVKRNEGKIRQLLKEGESITDIANLLGCKRPALYYYLYKFNILEKK